ncbi:upstream stimulatory factor 1 isoform X6 [Oncorhynchus tshawytscha]|uniref:upstream stimulatory factor 1 isoform X6 n=1 Tax=Oncorhynchus tshawytscha TaxID=74940 RepID=UPI000D0A04F7|nr:upstream stimulatory factor 1 isoform X6 [Oncorhynchus tshawytscha]
MKGQQKSPDDDGDVPIIDEGERHREYSMIYHNGAVATADDPTAITTIQSAATFSSDQPIKYLFKTEGGGLPVGELYPPSGQVTYRVIQVSDGQVDGQTDGASAVSVVTGFPATTQTVTQAVFSQSEGLEGEASETHYYYPVTDATQTTMVENVQAPETLLTQSTPTGQLYVMMSPQDVLGGTNQSKSEPPRTSRDDKRRAQHNEVERRRRDKINNWIVQLSKTIPDCTLDATKNGQTLFRLTVFIKPASFYGATCSRVRIVTTRGLENEPELRGSPKLKSIQTMLTTIRGDQWTKG